VPTVAERLATIEEQVRGLREDVATLAADIGDRRNPESIRGRLHTLEGAIASIVLRRSAGLGMLRSWQAIILVACAIATAVAAWYSVVGH
jgi:hypothetical protein